MGLAGSLLKVGTQIGKMEKADKAEENKKLQEKARHNDIIKNSYLKHKNPDLADTSHKQFSKDTGDTSHKQFSKDTGGKATGIADKTVKGAYKSMDHVVGKRSVKFEKTVPRHKPDSKQISIDIDSKLPDIADKTVSGAKKSIKHMVDHRPGKRSVKFEKTVPRHKPDSSGKKTDLSTTANDTATLDSAQQSPDTGSTLPGIAKEKALVQDSIASTPKDATAAGDANQSKPTSGSDTTDPKSDTNQSKPTSGSDATDPKSDTNQSKPTSGSDTTNPKSDTNQSKPTSGSDATNPKSATDEPESNSELDDQKPEKGFIARKFGEAVDATKKAINKDLKKMVDPIELTKKSVEGGSTFAAELAQGLEKVVTGSSGMAGNKNSFKRDTEEEKALKKKITELSGDSEDTKIEGYEKSKSISSKPIEKTKPTPSTPVEKKK